MLDFLLPSSLVSHRLPVAPVKSFISDGISRSSGFDYGTREALPVSPITPLAGPYKGQQAGFNAQDSLKSPPPLSTRSGERKDSVQNLRSSSRSSDLLPPVNKGLSPPLLSIVGRKGSGKRREAIETLPVWSQRESELIEGCVVQSQPKKRMDPLDPPVPTLTRRPARTAQRQPTIQPNPQTPTEPAPKTPTAGRFPFFSKHSSVQERSSPSKPNEELMDVSIQAALFPTGQADSSSPAAFKSLVQNAERLLSRLQTAYKECIVSLQEMATEKETQGEELEGCQMRARHLKLQLDNMTAKFAEQDQAMMNLVDELAQEKQLRHQELGMLRRSARPTTAFRAEPMYMNVAGNPAMHEVRRGSNISTLSVISDSGFESDEESPINRISSKHQDAPSPSVSASSVSTHYSHDITLLTSLPPPTISYPLATAQPSRAKAPSSAPTLFLSAAVHKTPASVSPLRNPFDISCANCQGTQASEAWNLVSILKDENRGLKERLVDLESSVDGCLGLVSRMVEKGR